MTSPTVLVLYSALLCFTMAVVLEQTADNNKFKNMISVKEGSDTRDVYSKNLTIRTRSYAFNNRIKLNNMKNSKIETSSYKRYEGVVKDKKKYEIHIGNNSVLNRHLNIHRDHVDKLKYNISSVKDNIKKNRVKREEKVHKCDSFSFKKGKSYISHPHIGDNDNVNYSGSTYCTTVISAPEGYVVQLTFVDMFHIEEHPDCSYDYLEIRDGDKGYYNLLSKVCGEKFPPQITTTGPNAWLKFYSDDTIEYKGFRIQIDFITKDTSASIPESCATSLSGKYGSFDSENLNEDCKDRTTNQALDYLWSIDVPDGHRIYLNFTTYMVGEPNECDKNFVQVFGSILEYEEKLAHYCGSVAMPVITPGPSAKAGEVIEDDDQGNIMHVRLYAAKEQRTKTFIDATFTAFRTLDLYKNNTCDAETEFDCQDNTCIDIDLKCNNYANCRLKADEEKDLCKHTTESLIQQPRIQLIVSIFGVILSGISLVICFKCIKKLYNDHKVIKEQIHLSCEDKLDSMIGSRLILDQKRMDGDSEPRESLERDNHVNQSIKHTNEMFKQQRNLQQKLRPMSIDSDYILESDLDLEEELLHQNAKNRFPKTEQLFEERSRRNGIENIKIEDNKQIVKEEASDIKDKKMERNERSKNKEYKHDFNEKETLTRSQEAEERDEVHELRDVSVSVPDTKQTGCQTRDSLFETAPILPLNGSGNANSRSLSKLRQSSASVVRPSPPQIKPSDIVIEVIKPIAEEERKPLKKVPDRRPIRAETTRSAPDVIILAKPTP
ncbi:uncharacterized protein LOC112043004 [Bicyclus anynana]|uniref:Uncharacterized protein LOC112043004 n=1 Tax=Bicyclus anynana TaxID=110368 RepID=A0A6J1MU66_BICAN|nr:uncharacterized protein LOC112043004 [Bicyclus anynana]